MTPTLHPRLLHTPAAAGKSATHVHVVPAVPRTSAETHVSPIGLSNMVWSFQADPAEDFFSEMWSPGLLDRLHVPLSRYHE
jgi:hypothetical protein